MTWITHSTPPLPHRPWPRAQGGVGGHGVEGTNTRRGEWVEVGNTGHTGKVVGDTARRAQGQVGRFGGVTNWRSTLSNSHVKKLIPSLVARILR